MGWGDTIAFAVATVAAVLFYGRFYVQWFYSERAGQSVMPVAFWYMSGFGSLMLLAWGFYLGSEVGTLSHCFNVIVYSRNLVHIYRKSGHLDAKGARIVTALAVSIAAVSFAATAYTWLDGWMSAPPGASEEATRNWLWVAVGVAGQSLFGLRFLVQWIATERKGESVIPVSFWWVSVGASILLASAHINQPDPQEWLFALGVLSPLPIYLRNLWLIYMGRDPALGNPAEST